MFLQAGPCWGLFAEVELEQAQADLELRFWCTNTIDWPREMIFCKYSHSYLSVDPANTLCDSKDENFFFLEGISSAYNFPGNFIIKKLCINMSSRI